jgi:DNA polymerase I-like protein with 3'-5' exonuclease and polymerase domains
VCGLPYDPAASRRAAREAERRAEAIEDGLGLAAVNLPDYWFGRGKDGQPVTVVDLAGNLRKGRGLAPYSTTPGGKPQVTAEVVAMMARDGIQGAAEYQRHRKLTTASQKWYRPYAAGTGADRRLRTVYRQVAAGASGEGGTRSGRFSVERVNLQAIPHDYRLAGEDSALAGIPTPRQIIGRALGRLDGWEGWELDLAQAELRLAALWAGAEGMLALIRDGQDLHGATATALFGVRKGEQAWDLYRQVAKRANFSLIFGAGSVTFAGMVHRETGRELSGREAERIVAEWNQLYPEFRQAIDSHSRAVDYARPGARGANLANGRVRWFSSWEDTHKAFNQRVQASLAELGKDWMIESDRLGRELGLDRRGLAAGVGRAGLLITIHDSQVWLLPAGAEGERIAKQVADLGRASWARLFPGVPGEVDAKRWG